MFAGRALKAVVAGIIFLALVAGLTPAVSAAATPARGATPQTASGTTTLTPSQIIAQVKALDKKAFAKRYKKLKTSKAVVGIVKATVPSGRVSKYLQLLTALSSNSQVSKLVAKTKGKHFKVTMAADGATSVKLLKGNGKAKVLDAGPKCWQAWAAWFAWLSATEALCWGAGALSPGLGVVCILVLGIIAFTLVDFNDACVNRGTLSVPVRVSGRARDE